MVFDVKALSRWSRYLMPAIFACTATYVQSPVTPKREKPLVEIPVHVFVDAQFEKRFGPAYPERLLNAASEIYTRELYGYVGTPFRFKISGRSKLFPDHKTSVEELLNDLKSKSGGRIIAFIDDYLYEKEGEGLVLIAGYADTIGGRAALVTSRLTDMQNYHKRLRKRTVHELGHLLGAQNSEDPESFMYNQGSSRSRKFDDITKKAIADSIRKRLR